MSQDYEDDIASIRQWLAKEPYLPEDFSDLMLKKFIHSCYGSLERTKKCIERFCTGRSDMDEIYRDRDPASKRIQTAFTTVAVAHYPVGKDEVLVHYFHDPMVEKFIFHDAMKAFTMMADAWLNFIDFIPDGQIIIFDLKHVTMRLIPKINIMTFRDYLIYVLEGFPVRVKQIHVVNCPSYVDKLYSLVKGVLPEEIRNIVNFHTTAEGVHKFLDKKNLPVDYGGEAGSIEDHNADWAQRLIGERELYLNNNLWKADLKRKPKSNVMENTMNGSFRTLSID